MYGEAEVGGYLAPGQSHWGEIRAGGGGVLSPKEEGGRGNRHKSTPTVRKTPQEKSWVL